MTLSIRQTNLLIAVGCLSLILAALVMQYAFDLAPCPLCITQRIFVIAAGLTALAAAIHHPLNIGRKIYAAFCIAFAGAGLGFALRHTWLQSLPEDLAPACGPPLGFMFENFPLAEAFELLLQGDGNCAKVVASFLGLSIPGWTAVAFIGLIAFGLWQMFRSGPQDAR
jgi:disulfide bond formation protein DsbB